MAKSSKPPSKPLPINDRVDRLLKEQKLSAERLAVAQAALDFFQKSLLPLTQKVAHHTAEIKRLAEITPVLNQYAEGPFEGDESSRLADHIERSIREWVRMEQVRHRFALADTEMKLQREEPVLRTLEKDFQAAQESHNRIQRRVEKVATALLQHMAETRERVQTLEEILNATEETSQATQHETSPDGASADPLRDPAPQECTQTP